jgi:hypothetical protein
LREAYSRHFKFDAIKPFQNSNKVFEDTLVPSKNPNCITIATLWQKCFGVLSGLYLNLTDGNHLYLEKKSGFCVKCER